MRKHVLWLTPLLINLFVAACGTTPENASLLPAAADSPASYISMNVNGFDVSLENERGSCSLVYSRKNDYPRIESKRIVLDMEAPCHFIQYEGKPQFYEYGKGKVKFKVFIVVGGPTDPKFPRGDDLMTKGCGTLLQKILIYSDRIRVDFPAFSPGAAPHCPSVGMEEVWYAT
jgi:hypothetical protein